MKNEDFFCKIGVKFVNKNGLSPKTYNYLITKDWINEKKKNPYQVSELTLPTSVFKIITEDGYDYKGAEVVIVNVDRCEGGYNPEWECLKVIKDLRYTRSDFSLGLAFNSNTFKKEDFHGEENNLLKNQLFNTCTDSTLNATKVEGICNCASGTAIKGTLSNNYSDKTNVYYNPFELISISSDGIICNSTTNLASEINYLQEEIEKLKNKESEENKMFNFENLKNKFQFGEYKEAKMSPYGIAFKTVEGYHAVNTKTMEVIDATGLVFDFNCVYAIPVAANAVKVGDFIIHNYSPVLVRAIHEDGTLKCWHVQAHEVITVLPVKSPFGFNFYTKLVSLIDNMGMTPTDANPFGNIWPLLLMDGKKDNKDMMMLMMLMNQQGGQFNPMMMYMMMGENKSDFLPMMLMMNGGFNFGMTPTNCKCNHPEEHGDYSKIINGEA